MGTPEIAIRKDGRAGPIDLALLAADIDSGYDWVSFRTRSGLWYKLTALKSSAVDRFVALDGDRLNVHLHAGTEIKHDDSMVDLLESPVFAAQALKNWVFERRKFPHDGEVSLTAAVINEGDRLMINGQRTSPVDGGWVFEHYDRVPRANF